MNTPVQYLFVGYPFAGKTVLAKELEKRFGFSRLSIDEVKFDLGYAGVSDREVSDEAWRKIFTELDERITRNLKAGQTVLSEYAWLTRTWRDRARTLASNVGIETIVIFVDTPETVVRKRWLENRKTGARFDVPDDVFEDALNLFESPTDDEHVIRFTYHDSSAKDSMNDWIQKHFT